MATPPTVSLTITGISPNKATSSASLQTEVNDGFAQTYVDMEAGDTAAKDRANHTGTQAIATVTGLQTALDTKAALASPALTGSPTAPTAAPGTDTTQIATTAFANAAVAVEAAARVAADALKAPLASPALTGTPTAPTAAPGANTTQVATTAFAAAAVDVEASARIAADALKAPLASPALTGTPTAPTAAPGTNTTQVATTAFAKAAVDVEASARAAQGKAALALLSAGTMTATKVSATWTISWTGVRGRVGVAIADVADVTDLVVGGSFAAVIDATAASPFAVAVESDDSTLRAALQAGTKIALILNRSGAISGALAGQAMLAQKTATLDQPIPSARLRGRASAGDGPVETLTPAQGRVMLEVDQVDNTPDNAKPISAPVAAVLDRPVRHRRWVTGFLAKLGVPLAVFDKRNRMAVSELEMWGDTRSAWLFAIKTISGKVPFGITRRGEVEAVPGAAMVAAIRRGLIAQAEPPLSSSQVISEATETILTHSVKKIVAERGGVTRLYSQRTDTPTASMILWSAQRLEYRAGSGQSNSVGGGFGSVGYVFTPDATYPGQALMFTGGARGTGGSAVTSPDLADFVPLFEVGVATQGETQGSGGLAWSIRRARLSGLPSNAAVFRSHGQGATAIADLSPGSVPYANGLAEIAAAVSVAARYGRLLRARSIWWDQGENDRNAWARGVYTTSQRSLIAAYNTDWGALLPGDNGAIHMYVTQLAASATNGAGNVSLDQYDAAKLDPLIHISTPNYIFGYVDNVHKHPRDHAHAGEYQMRATEWQEATGDWTGLRPASVSRVGAVITIVFDVPEGALEFSTDILPAMQHWGFFFTDDSASASILSVAITAADTVTITLTGVPVGANPRISYAHDSGAPAISGRAKEWGNLVSRSADPSFVYPTRNLDHYCQIFQEPV